MPSSDYAPSVAEVAYWLRTRTKDQYGNELGTFTSGTRPTDTEVQNLITAVMDDEVSDEIGDDIPNELWPSAKRIVSLRTAMAIELSYFSEQVTSNRSPYNQLSTWYEHSLAALKLAVSTVIEGGIDGAEGMAEAPLWGGGDYPRDPGRYPLEYELGMTGYWPTQGLPNDLGPFPGIHDSGVDVLLLLQTRIPALLGPNGGLKVEEVGSGGGGGGGGGTDPATETTLAEIDAAIGSPADAAASTTGTLIGQIRRIKDLLTGTLSVSGPLTNTELRATAVPVSLDEPIDVNIVSGGGGGGATGLTDTQLRATPVPVTPSLPPGASTETTLALAATALGAPSDAAASTTGSVVAQLRRVANLLAGTLTVTGNVGVTGSVAVTGPVTDAQLRASAVPVSLASQPLPTGASTETTLASALAGIGAPADAAATSTGSIIAQARRIANLLAGTLTVSVTGSVAVTGTFWQATQPVSGTFWQATQPVSLASVPSHAVTNAGTFAVQDALAETALGAPTDAAATTTGSVIAQLRRIANSLAGSLAVTGTFWQATQPVSAASLPLPTGASTETTLASVLTGVGAPADAAATSTGSVIAQLRRVANLLAGTLAISAASLPLPTGAAADATLTGGSLKAINRGGAKGATTAADITSTASGVDHQAIDAVLYDASGNRIGTSTTPLRTDPTGTTTQPISAAALPLPTGAAIETTQVSILAGVGAPADAAWVSGSGSIIAVLKGIFGKLGGTLAVSGTFWQATQPISAASLPLPTGAATETTLAAANTVLGTTADVSASGTGTINAHLRRIADLLAGTLTTTGGAGGTQYAEDVASVGAELMTLAGAIRQDTPVSTTSADGDYANLKVDSTGKLWVAIGAMTLPTGASTEATLASVLTGVGTPTDAAATTTGSIIAQLRRIANSLAGTIAVSGTFWQATQPISAAALPLPTGAATETSVALSATALGAPADAAATTTGSVIAQLRRIANQLAGTLTTTITGSVAVTGTFWQTTQPVSGTFWQATQPISAASLPLPTGAATQTTSASLLTGIGTPTDGAATVGVPDGSVISQLKRMIGYMISGVAVTGTFWQATQPVSLASQPLPTGASTETTLGSVLTGIGAPSDAAATTTGSVIAQLRRIANSLAGSLAVTGTFWQATQPISAASLPLPTGAATETSVALSATALGTPADAAATTTGSVIAQLRRIANSLAGSLAVTGTFWQATQPVSLAASVATTSAASSQADGHSVAIGSTTDAASTTTGSAIAHLRKIRDLLTGTLTVSISGSPSITGTVTSLNNAATSGGWTPFKLISAANTNAGFLKASAGQVGGWYVFNAAAATRYVKLYNKASAPTVGTDVPVWIIAVPAGGAANQEFTNGLAFGTGIAYATTTGMADTDNTAVALNDLSISLAWK